MFLDLPVGEDNPVRRMEWVAECINYLMNMLQTIVAYGIFTAVGMSPSTVQNLAFELFSHKATVVATNVPGPPQSPYMAGCALREMMAWVPQTVLIGIGISIPSYNGRVHFGLIADGKSIPDLRAVTRRAGAEFGKLLYRALLANWEVGLDSKCAETPLPAQT